MLKRNATVQVREEAKARGTSVVTLRRTLEAASGCMLLRFTCALWVYNCSGLPLALQKVLSCAIDVMMGSRRCLESPQRSRLPRMLEGSQSWLSISH